MERDPPGRWIAPVVVGGVVVMAVTARVPEAGMAWRAGFVAAAMLTALLAAWTGLRHRWPIKRVLVIALVLRGLVFPLTPTLSDDGYRYVWDGRLLAHEQIDPYAYRPSDPELIAYRDDMLYPRLNSPDYYSVYPPVSQFVFGLGGLLYPLGWLASWYGIKLLVVLFEVGGMLLLRRWVRGEHLLLYAWSPLAVIEVAGQGHTEGLAVGLLLGTLWSLREKRQQLAGAFIAAAGWVKLVPFVLIPLLVRRLGRWGMASTLAVAVLLLTPFASAYWWPHVRTSLQLYSQYFEFYAGPYLLLKQLAGSVASGPSISIGPLLQIVFLITAGLLAIRTRLGRTLPSIPHLAAAACVLLSLFFALSTTVHPWYLLLILGLLPLIAERRRWRYLLLATLWLSGWSMATYLHYTGPDWVYPGAIAIGWIGWGILLMIGGVPVLLARLMRRRARSKWTWIRSSLAAPVLTDHVLDLGAGEGYVGEVVQQETQASVTLVDVADFHTVSLPFVRYDGHTLPFERNRFDLTLLVFVLHHTEDPGRVLREALRVTSGSVVVLESVYDSAFQHWLLRTLDILANRLRSQGTMRSQEEHLQFRTINDWKHFMGAHGARIEAVATRGGYLHRQALFVLRSDPSQSEEVG